MIIYQDEMWKDEDTTFSKDHKDLMGEEVVQAMDDRYCVSVSQISGLIMDSCLVGI